MTFRKDMFGDAVRGEVTIVNGKAEKIRVHRQGGVYIDISADDAGGIAGTDQEIIDQVADMLNGAPVTKA